MDCNEALTLLDGYMDGELDLVNAMKVEGHIRDCEACSHAHSERLAVRSALRGASDSLYYRAPERLERNIRRALLQEQESRRENILTQLNGFVTIPPFWRWGGASATVALAAFAMLAFLRVGTLHPVTADESFTQEVVASHTRSLMAEHLMDVISTDKHTVKPWFNGRIDFSPPVVDLKTQGFPLVGGRLDELGERPVAALVYRRNKHIINLFLWPKNPNDAPMAPGEATRRGYNVIHWTQTDMNCCAVSDLNTAELSDFVHEIQTETAH